MKTVSFRMDQETFDMLQQLKSDMSVAYGFSISNSDVLRKSLDLMEIDWKWGDAARDIYKDRWKE